jgi:FlaG/FlaF family flagellin (archaellin)
MVAITVVLAAVLYVMVSGMIGSTEQTPRGSLTFSSDPEIPYKYKGSFEGSVLANKVEITLYDSSADASKIMDEPTDGENVTVGASYAAGLLTLEYDDVNTNNKIDAADTFIVNFAGSGDVISIVYKPTGETVATRTIT